MSDYELTAKAYNPQGVEICYYDEPHIYETDKCKNFTSVTTFIEEFFPPFDEYNISKRYAEKHNKTQKEVLADWKAINDEANLQGTNVHLYCECVLTGQPIPEPRNKKEVNIRKSADKAIEKLLSQYELVESEKIIFSEKYKLAGTVDLIMRNKENDNILLFDWKTNKKIEKSSYWKEYGFPPIEHLEKVNFNHYSLQLNLYKWLLLKEGYYSNISEMKIVHLLPTKDVWYDIDDMQKEIDDMIAYEYDKSEIDTLKDLMRSIRLKSKRGN